MEIYIGSVCLALLTSSISADLSKFYKGGEEAYDDYDYYEEDSIGGYDDVSEEVKEDNYDSKTNNRGRDSVVQEARDNSGGGEGFSPEGGIDFTGCEDDPDTGRCCITKEEQITTLTKSPILECTHKDYEQCHYTYVTQFRPTQQELCEETFDKQCSISFVKKATNDTLQKCYKPLVKVCGKGRSGQFGNSDNNFVDQQEEYGGKRRKLRFKKETRGGENKKCTTFFESSCTTRYVEKSPGKFVADTSCEKLPVELCGQGCGMEPGPEECHDKVVVSVVDVPEEVCDLNPVKSCRFATKLVPHLSPTHECTVVPKEVCVLKFSTPQQVQKPLLTKWCLDPTEPEPGESYDEGNAGGSPIGPRGQASFNTETVVSNDLDNHDPNGQPGDGYDVPNDISANTYDGPSKAADDYGAPDSAEENNAGGDDGAADDYGAPDKAADIYSAPSNGSPNTAADIYGAPKTVVDNYGAPNTAADDYGAPNKAADIYSAPNTAADNSGDPNTAADNYGAPITAAEDYGAPNTAADNYGAPNKAADIYGAPNTAADNNRALDSAGENYGAPKTAADNYGAPNTVAENYGAPNTSADNYGVPNAISENYDYEDPNESLDTYRSSNDDSLLSNKNYGSPSSQIQSNYKDKEANQIYESPNKQSKFGSANFATKANSVAPNYKIDNGFGTSPTNAFDGPTNDLGAYRNQNSRLGRYLTPPKESRKSKSNQSLRKNKKRRNKNQHRRRSKQSNTRIRSVDPHIYV